MRVGERRPSRGVIGSGPSTGRAATSPTVKRAERPGRHLLQAEDVGVVRGREPDHLVAGMPGAAGGERVPVEEVPAPDEHTSTLLRVRVLLADPPAFTPWYDHELAAALARAGADVSSRRRTFASASSRRRTATARTEAFYPLSSRLFRRSRAAAAAEGGRARSACCAVLARARPDVVHVQWLALPQVDVRLRFRSPSVFTAHDLLPRRTAAAPRAVAAAARSSTASSCTPSAARETLADLGIDARVIPHPVYPSAATRATTVARCSRSA